MTKILDCFLSCNTKKKASFLKEQSNKLDFINTETPAI